jgi:NADPH-dependent F420 reductase
MGAVSEQPSRSTISIIGGTGALGMGLALRLAQQGVPVVIGSRDAQRAVTAAQEATRRLPGCSFDGLANGLAAERSQVVFLTVPFRSHAATLASLADQLREGQVLVDCTVPLAAAVSGKATRVLGVWQGSAAQQAQELAPEGVRVVSALHTVSAASFRDLDHALDEDTIVCGKKVDKAPVLDLLSRIPGLRAVDGGPLENSRTTEALTALLIGFNARYKTHAGIRVTGLPVG